MNSVLMHLLPAAQWLAKPMCLLAQAEVTSTEAIAEGQVVGEDGVATGAPTEGLLTQILGNPLNLILMSGILFVLLVLRPQQKQMKQQQQALAALKKNDRVITSGGIHGTVVQVSPEESVITLRIDENSNARMTINRDAVAKIVSEDKE